jgi:glutamate-1-semialdehyde aminotransferase
MNLTQSMNYLTQAKKVIPLASQTFSKSHLQYPLGISPVAIDRAKGSYTYDIDGNCYLDMVNSLAAIILGYCDQEVNDAVKIQLDKGTIFSLPSPIELEVSQLLVDIIPCAEMVRFGKNASDATTAAIRVSRAKTGRDRVAVCGYHGWHDWYIGTTSRSAGVPDSVTELTDTITYNDITSLTSLFEKNTHQYAAVILEPMNAQWPSDNFLEKVKNICKEEGAVLIFDETVTGFRYGLSGAQGLFNVEPDLCVLGKGMANGFPLSAVVGKEEIMQKFNDIFFSTTFGGETISLAAAKATINKLQKHNVLESIYNIGLELQTRLNNKISEYQLSEKIKIIAHPAWSFVDLSGFPLLDQMKLKTLYIQTMLENNIICLGTHNISYTFGETELELLCAAYDNFFKLLTKIKNDKDLDAMLSVPSLQPIMKVR